MYTINMKNIRIVGHSVPLINSYIMNKEMHSNNEYLY